MDDISKADLPNIPLEELFTEIELPEDKIPLRWWNMKTTTEYLGVSERSVRYYKAEGKLEYKYLMVKGHRKVYFSNRSVISVAEDRKWRKQHKEADAEGLDVDYDTEDLTDEEKLKLNAISFLLSGLLT